MSARTHEQEIVLQIQRDNGVDEESLQKVKDDPEMSRTIANLQRMVSVTTELLSNELYTKPAHCVLEILQNADDNLYDQGVKPELHIKLRADSMEIACNEVGFQDAHVRAFCGIRQSTKQNQAGYIGEKGIGAKSIFKVARRVTIQSRGYSFELNRERKLGMITPVWVSGLPATPGWTTMRLELADKNQFGILKAQLLEIRSTVLLFLRKLSRLVVDDGAVFDSTKSLTGNILSLDTKTKASVSRSLLVSTRYLRVTHSVVAARDDEKRRGQTSTSITLAFPLKLNDEPLSAPTEMVYAFLPLRQAGFRFLLQADFLTAANREDILTDRQWNVAIRDAVSTSFVVAVDIFKATPSLRYTWFCFLPREHEVAHAFFAPIRDQINTQLRTLPIIWTDREDWLVPSMCVRAGHFKMTTVDDEGSPLIQSQYLPYSYVSNVYAPDVKTILGSLGVRDLCYTDFLEGLRRMHVDGVFATQPPSWLEDVCDSILSHGVSRSRRGKQFFQNEAVLRGLPLAQRQDGSWSTFQRHQVSSLFFDASGSAFPSGLSIEVLNLDNIGPRRRQLLRQLGVRDVDVNLVVEKIISLHRSTSVPVRDVVGHLQYIFKNRHLHRNQTLSTSLWLVDSAGGRLVRGADAYMESSAALAAELRLGSLFGIAAHGKFLHVDLIPQGSATTGDIEWRNWLESSLGVATAPRLKLSGLPSADLELIVNSYRVTATSKLLSILQAYWAGMLGQLPAAGRPSTATVFYDYLSKVEVRCTNGVLAPLGSTYVLNDSIKPFATPDMRLLPVPDNVSDWSFLKNCGVTIDVNAVFFLKGLRTLATQNARDVSVSQVEALYRQLESRFHEIPETIRNAFHQEPLILVGSAWRNAENVVWNGPPFLKLKRRLKFIYPHLAVLFRTHLVISDAPDEVVAAELQHFALSRSGKPLNRDDVERLRSLLAFGSDTIEKVEKGDMADWTTSLLQEAILPMRMPDSNEIRLASASSGSFYLPDPSGVLATEFATKVPFIDLDPAMVISMQPLLVRLGIYNRRIDKFVTRQVMADGAPLEHVVAEEGWNIAETSFFVHKLPLLERAHYFTMEKPLPVRSALVFNVNKLHISYTLSGSKTFVISSTTDCWSTVQEDQLLIFLSAALDQQDHHNYPVAEAIVSALGMRHEQVALLRSILHDTDRDIAHLLKASGIHDMPEHLRQSFEEPIEVNDYEDIEMSDSEEIINATTEEVTVRQSDQHASSSLSGTGVAGLGAGHKAPRRKRRGAAGRFRGSAGVDSGSGDNLEVRFLESCAEGYNLQPALRLSAPVHNVQASLSLATSPTVASQSGGGSEVFSARNMDNVSASARSGQPEDPVGTRIGFLGENFVFKLLSKSLPGFSVSNWTSNLRVHAGHSFFPGVELADFVYQDTQGVLTSMLFPEQPSLISQRPEYFIEVKSTRGAASEPFHLSRRQFEQALAMTRSDDGKPGSQIFVIFRISHISSGEVPHVDVYADPHELFHRGTLRIVSKAVEVRIAGEKKPIEGPE